MSLIHVCHVNFSFIVRRLLQNRVYRMSISFCVWIPLHAKISDYVHTTDDVMSATIESFMSVLIAVQWRQRHIH